MFIKETKEEIVYFKKIEESDDIIKVKVSQIFKISKIPLIITFPELENLKIISKYIFNLANETLFEILNDNYKNKNEIEWIESNFKSIEHFWKNKKIKGINIMRVDFAWDNKGNLKVLELNTEGQQGWIFYDKWQYLALSNKYGKILGPDHILLSKYLIKKLGTRIAIITSKYYSYDFKMEIKMHSEKFIELGVKCKIINLSKEGIKEFVDFNPTGIYWKGNPDIMDNINIINDLINETNICNLPQIPNFESIFISDNKAFLTNLRNKDTMNIIPDTYNLSKNNLIKNMSFFEKNISVLKPGCLSCGNGIKFGKDYDDDVWIEHLKNAMKSDNNYVLQKLCNLNKFKNNKYQDIAIYIIDGEIKGIISRESNDIIVNINKNGLLKPVVLK